MSFLWDLSPPSSKRGVHSNGIISRWKYRRDNTIDTIFTEWENSDMRRFSFWTLSSTSRGDCNLNICLLDYYLEWDSCRLSSAELFDWLGKVPSGNYVLHHTVLEIVYNFWETLGWPNLLRNHELWKLLHPDGPVTNLFKQRFPTSKQIYGPWVLFSSPPN